MANAVSYVHGIIPSKDREKDDYYPTPPEGTQALLAVESFPGLVWEPACGCGVMAREIEAAGSEVLATDLIDRGYGLGGVDFLTRNIADEWGVQPQHIVTNPPFKHAEDFARLALDRVPGKVALLCRLAWLEGIKRRKMFESTPLARVWVFSKRLSMQRGRLLRADESAGMVAFAWYVWDRSHEGSPRIGWL